MGKSLRELIDDKQLPAEYLVLSPEEQAKALGRIGLRPEDISEEEDGFKKSLPSTPGTGGAEKKKATVRGLLSYLKDRGPGA